MTLDKNGNVIRCGDIVKIENAYFKNDNGYWWVEQDGSNKAYLGKGLTMTKMCKNGKISRAKYNISFYPLQSFCSDHEKNALANEHNAKYATIEITSDIKNDYVIEWIREEIKKLEEQAQYWKWQFGDKYNGVELDAAEYFKTALARLTGEQEEM